jgi:ketosteroid isomerase-like protein
MAGEKAAFEDDAEAVSRILGDDLLFVTPDGEQPMDKAQRVAAIRKLRNAGRVALPPAVASIAVWVFGNAAVMSADQESRFGEALHATRVWAKRDGRWQLSFSQQTLVQ